MVLTFNRKMMSPDELETPGQGQTSDADEVYENAGYEQEAINVLSGDALIDDNSLTLNLTNFLSDYGAVAEAPLCRISEKESKGAENLANGKPRYYPADFVEATKEQVVESEPDEPVDPPADPQDNV